MGRPSKFTPTAGEAIVGLLRQGCTESTALRTLGLSARALHGWLAKGKARPRSEHGKFRSEFLKARAERIKQYEQTIMEAVRGYKRTRKRIVMDKDGNVIERHAEEWDERDPRMALFALERLMPDVWGRRDPIPPQVAGITRIQINFLPHDQAEVKNVEAIITPVIRENTNGRSSANGKYLGAEPPPAPEAE